MHSTDPTTAGDVSSEGDLLVSIPRPRWRTIRRVCVFGFSLFVSLSAGFLMVDDLVHHKGMTAAQRALLMGLAGMFCFNALVKVVLLRLSLKLPLEIFKSGIAFQGVIWSWEAIEECRWARYSPDTLEVRFHRLRSYLPIPGVQRAAVEAALRDLGKWQP